MQQSHFLIGAATSGSGKTTLMLGLLRALTRKGWHIQAFKCGPDYIDTWHHWMVTGKPSINLDRFMMSDEHIRSLYRYYTSSIEVAITEGVMGLFDGYDGMKGSSAEIAELLHIPVVLVVNAKSTAYSVAPLLYGFKHFRPQLNIIGVIFNFVSSTSHYEFLRKASEDAGIESLGYLPKQSEIAIPSRHLGLSMEKNPGFEQFFDRIADLVEQSVDLERLLEKTAVEKLSCQEANFYSAGNKRIAVAYDEAFNFMYAENIETLKREGEVFYFSPLRDTELPAADFVYLPGGYPELYVKELSSNRQMRETLFQYIEQGGRLLAECGGMMYLCRSLADKEGNVYPMVGILPQDATMEKMKLKLGYRQLFCDSYRLCGHEFHYSSVKNVDKQLISCAEAWNARGERTDVPLYRYKNLLAGYTHLYWSDPASNQWFKDFLIGKW